MPSTSSAAPMVRVPGYYVWQSSASSPRILFRLDLIERMLPSVMAGFGAVPKRGAEVGGVLLGRIEPGTPTVVRIEDFEQVPCRYKRGPSYLLSDADLPVFESTVLEYASTGSDLRPVGYFRSHTREGQSLGPDDIELCNRFFPPPDGVVLLIRPYATKTSTAGFLAYVNGILPAWPRLEFPFRRADLAPSGAPAEHPDRVSLAASPKRSQTAPPAPAAIPREAARAVAPVEPSPSPEPASFAPPAQFTLGGYLSGVEAQPRRGLGWRWVPLAFVLVFAGVLAGFFAAKSAGFGVLAEPAPGGDPYSLSLSASHSEDNLLIRWNRQSSLIREARRGALRVSDGTYTKTLELSPSELQNGTVVFHNTGQKVTVGLAVYLDGRRSVENTLEWQP